MIVQSDAISLPFADKSVDLVLGSPPYCDCRTYGIGAQRDCQPWIDWMLVVTTEALRVSSGAVIWVAAGVTRDRNYWPACEGLMYEWWKRGGSMYRPCYWHRVGIPGSGGDQWFRADVEHVMCFKRPGRLPFTDNTAMGHPPKWAPGGEMSYRMADGARTNQWGKAVTGDGDPGKWTERGVDGQLKQVKRKPSHVVVENKRYPTRKNQDGIHGEKRIGAPRYQGVAVANPGTLIQTAVGFGHLGDKMAHESEAPYPEKLAEFFVRSLCPEGGIVLDPFSGSGTTAKVAETFGRIGIGSDIRASQTALTKRRLNRVQKQLFA